MKSIIFIGVLVGIWLFVAGVQSCSRNNTPIKIGILHSLTGTMAFSEKPLVNAVMLGVDEINAAGGVLGREVQAIVVDGQSDDKVFAQEAERLIVEEKVSVIFGCWTSTCRKAVKPVVEKYAHLLFYPVQYEGLESSRNIVYTGAVPNQQIIPSIAWIFQNLGKRFYLIGSDYVYPRTANLIVKDIVKAQGGTILAERYIPLGTRDVQTVVTEIGKLQPDVVINTINGDSNIAFFKALNQLKDIPVFSFSLAEAEVNNIGREVMVGHYAAWNYFQSIQRPENQQFIQNYKARYGASKLIDDPMEASYIGVHLWARAISQARSTIPDRLINVLGKQSINAPEGIVSIDQSTLHLWKKTRIGRIQEDGQFEIVWSSPEPIRPVPFPTYRSESEWRNIIKTLNVVAY